MITQKQFPLTSSIDQIFNELLQMNIPTQKSTYSFGNALLNIYERETEYLVQVIAPGHEKSHFSVVAENDMLVIEATLPKDDKKQKEKCIRNDFKVSNFKKMVHLDRKVVGDPINASYENGILNITLPKLKPEIHKRNQIRIN